MIKKVTTIYLILSLAVLLAVGAFFYFGTKKCQEENINQPVGEDNQEQGYQIIPAEKTDCEDELDVSCWNTYVDDYYNFTIKYPKEWRARKMIGRYDSKYYEVHITPLHIEDEYYAPLLVFVHEDINFNSIREWWKNKYPLDLDQLEFFENRNFVNSTEGIRFKSNNRLVKYYILYGNNIILITPVDSQEDLVKQNLMIDTIVSTLQANSELIP